jgi:phosphatidate phosphatase LPIN
LDPETSPVFDFSDEDIDKAEWHDAYRCIKNRTKHDFGSNGGKSGDNPSSMKTVASMERLTWGWGGLPVVKSSVSLELLERSRTCSEDGSIEMPKMIKSESIYFDAIETESLNVGVVGLEGLGTVEANVSDHPCMSLCGDLLEQATSEEEAQRIFSEHLIVYEYFRENSVEILQNPNLMFLIDGKIYPYNSHVQAHLISKVLFPNSCTIPLTYTWSKKNKTPKRRSVKSFDPAASFPVTPCNAISAAFENSTTDSSNNAAAVTTIDSTPKRWFQWFRQSSFASSDRSSDSEAVLSEPEFEKDTEFEETQQQEQPDSSSSSSIYYRKSLSPSQEELNEMELEFGENQFEFVLHDGTESELRIGAKLFLWPITAKIVITEIDGAISRLAGTSRMFSTLFLNEEQSFHPGAPQFYSKLAENGYHIVYLSCRGIHQADVIQDILKRSEQGKFALPKGPVLLNPDGLVNRHQDEMYLNATREFQVAALNGIRALFPLDINPFYAAFGKTYSDSVIFTQVGVFPGKVFLMDEADGQLRHRTMINYKESYLTMMQMTDKMFPDISSSRHSLYDISPLSSSFSTTSSIGSISPNGIPIDCYPSASSHHHSPLSCGTYSRSRRALSAAVGSNKSKTAMDSSSTSPDDTFLSERVNFHSRTRSMGDEAFNDVNFWKIRPGSVL